MSVMNPHDEDNKQDEEEECGKDNHRHWCAGRKWAQTARQNRLAERIKNRMLLTLIRSTTPRTEPLGVTCAMHHNPARATTVAVLCKNDVLPTNRACAASDLHAAQQIFGQTGFGLARLWLFAFLFN